MEEEVVKKNANAPGMIINSNIMKASKKRRLKDAVTFYLFISPWLLVFLALGLIPLLWGLYLSFTNYTGYNFNNLKIVGFQNYQFVFADKDAISSLSRTLLFTVMYVPLNIIVGFLLAVLLNNKLRGLSIYRTIFYLPSVIPVVATGLMWKTMYAQDGGLFNNILGHFGIKPLNFLGYGLAPSSMMFMLLWGAGGGLMIYLAGLKGVPQSLYESAAIDGANSVQRFWKITVPFMTPLIYFNLLMSVIGALQIFAQPMILTPGAQGLVSNPIQPIYLFMVHAWLQIFNFQRYAYGLALIWVMFVVGMALALIIHFTSKFWVHYETSGE